MDDLKFHDFDGASVAASFPKYAAITFGSLLTLGTCAIGDLLAIIEDGDPFAAAHDDFHVMLDKQHRQAEFLLE